MWKAGCGKGNWYFTCGRMHPYLQNVNAALVMKKVTWQMWKTSCRIGIGRLPVVSTPLLLGKCERSPAHEQGDMAGQDIITVHFNFFKAMYQRVEKKYVSYVQNFSWV